MSFLLDTRRRIIICIWRPCHRLSTTYGNGRTCCLSSAVVGTHPTPTSLLHTCVENSMLLRSVFLVQSIITGSLPTMQWIKKKLGGDGDSKSAPFIVGSHTWLGSTTDHKGEKASPVVYEPPVEETEQHGGDSGDSKSMERLQSMTPPSGSSSTDMSRSKSLGSALKNGFSRGDKKQQQQQSSAMYPKVYEGKSMEELAKEEGSDEDDGDDSPVEAREECLVTVPNAMVHLIDDQQSPHLATGHFSIVRITQKGRGKGKGSKNWNGIVVLVRVGEHLHWPLMKDEATVKLDPTHYFFTLPVPSSLEEKSGDSNSEVIFFIIKLFVSLIDYLRIFLRETNVVVNPSNVAFVSILDWIRGDTL